jgi:hypothetical protein
MHLREAADVRARVGAEEVLGDGEAKNAVAEEREPARCSVQDECVNARS